MRKIRRGLSRIGEKCISEAGASLSIALLFFVLCAVCASVILTAASAAAGRIRRISTSDQSCYSVRSAARYLNECFSETELLFRETRTTVRTIRTAVRQNASGETAETEESILHYSYTAPERVIGSTAESLQEGFLGDAALTLYRKELGMVQRGQAEEALVYEAVPELADLPDLSEDAAERLWAAELGTARLRSGETELLLLLRESAAGTADAALSSAAKLRFERDGGITVTELCNTEPDAGGGLVKSRNAYTMQLSIPAEKRVERRIVSESTEDDLSGMKEDGTGVRVTTTTTVEEKLTSLLWGVGRIRKGRAD